jgi:hypothetical protein
MQGETRERGPQGRSIVFKAGFEGKPDKPLVVVAYMFDRKGRLYATSPVKDGQAQFQIEKKQLKGVRLFFGPELPKERYGTKQPTLETMARLQAYEPAWRFERDKDVYELLPIPESLWPWWWWCLCRVRGRVIKTVYTGGATYEVPVCNARVHICEVDPLLWVIPRLPDVIIWRLRDELLKVLVEPPRRIPPDPGPLLGDDPRMFDVELLREAQLTRAHQVVGPAMGRGTAQLGPQPEPPDLPSKSELAFARGRVEINPQPEPPGGVAAKAFRLGTTVSSRLSKAGLSPQPEPPSHALRMMALASLPAESRSALSSNSIPTVRRALIDNVALIHPYICLWPWLWPFFLRCDEVAVVTTDENGRFDTYVGYRCFGDHPDLYFWVEYPIDGVLETVYRPNIRCHTYWNYECGSEVTIRITDERVPGCWDRPEVIGKKVVVKSIGRRVSMGDINRASMPAEAAKEGTGKGGELLHDGFPEWATKEVAFGKILELRVDFGNGLKDAGVTHYLWSYRPLGSTSDTDWTPIEKEVRRYYRVATPPGDPVKYRFVRVGPDDDHGLFVIDPELPADGEDWEVLNESHDLASARFETRVPEVDFGKFELKLELFREAGGTVQRIDLTDESVELYETTTRAPFLAEEILTAAPTVNRKIEEDVGGVGHLFGYRLVLHIDNRVCFGTINDPVIDGVGAGPCGFLEYDPDAVTPPSVQISFRASHPGNFAAFSFVTTRVATDLPSASAHQLVEAVAANEFTRVADTFTKSVSVSTLLSEGVSPGDSVCVRAAFAEDLDVYALVTDGYRRLWELDGPRSTLEDPTQIDVRAFVVTPEEPAS